MSSLGVEWRKSKPWVRIALTAGVVLFVWALGFMLLAPEARNAGMFYLALLGVGTVCLAAAELLPDRRSPAVLGLRAVFYLIWLMILMRQIFAAGQLLAQIAAALVLVASIVPIAYYTAAWVRTWRSR